ncbi:MAG: TonB family protein [Opitutaceae bacterium]|nr:TonB family protein [Opitutaceae bacterium]
MKTPLLRTLVFGFCGWILSFSSARATSPVRITCVACAEEYVTNREDCPRCRFIHIGGRIRLMEDERAHLRTFLASEKYLASLSGPTLARVLLLYEHVPIAPFERAGVLLSASAMFARPADDESRLLATALVALNAVDSAKLRESDRPILLLRLTEVLRRLSRFDEARVQLDKLRALKPALPNYMAVVPDIEAELIEERLPFARPMFPPAKGKISARPIAGRDSVFGLPMNDRPVIAHQPMTWKYPIMMRYSGIVGEVMVAIDIAKDGTVTNAKSLRASQPEFVETAVAYARECRFSLTEIDGNANRYEGTLAVLFTLSED